MTTHSAHYFFIAMIAIAAILAGLVFLPYFSSILIALTLSILFRPLHRWVSKHVSKGNEASGLSSFISLVIIAIVIITPLFFLVLQLYGESQTLYTNLTEEGTRASIINSLNDVANWFTNHFFGVGSSFNFNSFNPTDYIQNVFQWAFTNFNALFSSVARIVLHLIIMFFALFYLLKDGASLRQQLITLSPLIDTYDDKILTKLDTALHSVVVGTLLMGLIQGFAIGLGFWAFGIPNPVLWGSIGVIIALIPGIGTSLMYIPAILFLFFSGLHMPSLGLLIWWVLAVSFIDNYIGPKLMNRGVEIHQFLILLSVLGGIAFFGPIGFIAGPMVIALLFALLDVYKTYRMAIQ